MDHLFSIKNLQKIRNNKIVKFFDGDILELGCGTGFIPKYLAKNHYKNNYTGIDIDKKNVEYLSNTFPKYNFLYHDLDEVLDLQKQFDTIISSAVIEHIYNQKNFFLTACKNLKIGGKLVITTPSNFGNDIIYPLMCKFRLRNGNGVLSDHITIYNKDRFMVVEKDFGLKIEHFGYFEFFCNQLIVYKKMKPTG